MWRWTRLISPALAGGRIDRLAGRTPDVGCEPSQRRRQLIGPRLRPRCNLACRGVSRPARSAACIRPSAVNASSTGTSGKWTSFRGSRAKICARSVEFIGYSRNTASTSWRKMTAFQVSTMT